MTGKILLRACALSLGVLLAGCGTSPPNHYYLLTPRDAPAPGGQAPAVGVGPIEIPQYLGRDNLVYDRRQNTLQVAGEALWGEPLANGIERVLVLNLASLLDTQDVRTYPWDPRRAPDYGVKVNLLELDTSGQEALLTAQWLVYRPASGESVERRISHLRLTLPDGAKAPERIAQAYSTLLSQLSETIATAIRAAAAGQASAPGAGPAAPQPPAT